jgi:hypothetical protein
MTSAIVNSVPLHPKKEKKNSRYINLNYKRGYHTKNSLIHHFLFNVECDSSTVTKYTVFTVQEKIAEPEVIEQDKPLETTLQKMSTSSRHEG